MVVLVQGLHHGLLLIGQYTTQHIHVLQHLGQFVDVVGQFARIHVHGFTIAGELDLAGYRADGHRIVARDDAAAHALLAEPLECGFGVGADTLGAQHQCHRSGCGVKSRAFGEILGWLAGTMGDQQHSVAFVGVLGNHVEYIPVVAVQCGDDDLGGTHIPCAGMRDDGAPLARR